jgi:hypothetical protein
LEWPFPFGFRGLEEGPRVLRFDDRRARLGFDGSVSGGGWAPGSGIGWVALSVAISKSARASWGATMASCRIRGQKADMMARNIASLEGNRHWAVEVTKKGLRRGTPSPLWGGVPSRPRRGRERPRRWAESAGRAAIPRPPERRRDWFYNSGNFLLASMGAHRPILQTKCLKCRVCYRTPGESGARAHRASSSSTTSPGGRGRDGEAVRVRGCARRAARTDKGHLLRRERNPSPARLWRVGLSLRERVARALTAPPPRWWCRPCCP